MSERSLVFEALTSMHAGAVLQMYRAVIDSFKDAAEVPEEAILDVRGNHDAFDVPDRCDILG